MLNVFDIFILAFGNWLQCCSLKSWAGISIRELKTLRNNLWSTEKQSHYNQEVLIFFKVQQENELQAGSQKSSLQSQCFSKASPSQVRPGWMITGWMDGIQTRYRVCVFYSCLWGGGGGGRVSHENPPIRFLPSSNFFPTMLVLIL